MRMKVQGRLMQTRFIEIYSTNEIIDPIDDITFHAV